MKILKYLFFLLLIVFIGGAIYFATKDGNYQIEKSQIINAPVEVVYNKVNNYKTREEWGPWKQEDSTTVFRFPEKTTGEGAGYSWNSKNYDGSLKTVEVVPNERIKEKMTLQTQSGERTADVYWKFEPVDGGTKVTWGMTGDHPLMDKAYFAISGKDFEGEMRERYANGLTALDHAVQKDLEVYSIVVDGVTQYGGGFYMYASTATKMEGLDQKMKQIFPTVSRFMEDNNITIAGKPMTLYNTYDLDNNSAIISCAIPTTTQVVVAEDSSILCGFMPAQTVIKTTLKGNYSNSREAWEKAMKYLKDNNYEQQEGAVPFDLYVNDPMEVPNPASWITELYIPIKVATEIAPLESQSL